MSRIPSPSPTTCPGAHALATLGMVAALVCLLTERVLPRLAAGRAGADARVVAALLAVQHAMLGLASAAWREIEAVPLPGGSYDALGVSPEVEVATERMHGALVALMAALAAHPQAPLRLTNAAPRVAQPGEAVAARPPAPRPDVAGEHPRDGPPAR